MRDDIFRLDKYGNPLLDSQGNKILSIQKVFGKNYNKGFFGNCHDRYRIFEGARATKKSYNMIGIEPVLKIMSQPLRNIVMLRQNDVDNRQSTFEQVCRGINDLGVDRSFSIRKNPLEIEYVPTGQKIIFRGLNNPTGLNGINFSNGFWTDSYIDEAFEVESYEDFRKLDGSMRGRLPDGYFFQLTMCLNAWNQDTWIYDEFFHTRLEDDYSTLDRDDIAYMDYRDKDFIGPFGKGLYLHKSTYKCNEFLSKDYIDSARYMREHSKDIYMTEFLGMWGNSTEGVYQEFNDTLIHPEQYFNEKDGGGVNKFDYCDFTIGIDTGLSNGQGQKRTVKRGENVKDRVKSATTMILCAVTKDFNKMFFLDEYFHSNSKAHAYLNTDNGNEMTSVQLMDACVKTIIDWLDHYGVQGNQYLMKGRVRIYIDSADIGFRQGLELKLREARLFQCECYGSTKSSIQSRVDFEKTMMAYGDLLVCDKCKNMIREFKNARRGQKGEAREDGDDHCLTAGEYGMEPMLVNLRRYKTFKQR